MKIQIELITELGNFKGEIYEVTAEEYENLLILWAEYYKEGGMELHLEDGSYIVVPPEIVKKSIYKVNHV